MQTKGPRHPVRATMRILGILIFSFGSLLLTHVVNSHVGLQSPNDSVQVKPVWLQSPVYTERGVRLIET
ncbi:MAG: hypothetical protein CGU28_13160 [Candidatus Dactylopiibacterium carminicum]|uniref:Uncharacterized protein n=1 Tax=Candidatus Dactylopiibacterium carminicum TaxID=857335 RepID=A0A272EQC1_9RHOO|nr:hypothetical protein [Candidatus Dactylopiibacterium carminicum]KAF7598292.1 hypothetical protein BGI27_14175 [Candidatus Dactylopiibacterium carminicum]PAS91910.1 MAG: hypothetical protein CGU29_13850 [Candidatus Dactylopiibacterium carminicum]PAS94966.1 MAG: hypothetical protein CGU28_13160 [Candidatus Dactylopiibacterium carminicum]PAS97224.1 MAG: hypothetical protein BSR46_14205 [Candidatus Dactylopiibacterium carminicum]